MAVLPADEREDAEKKLREGSWESRGKVDVGLN